MKPKLIIILFAMILFALTNCKSGNGISNGTTVGEITGPDEVSEISTADYSITIENTGNETCQWALEPVSAGVLSPTNELTTTLTPNPVDQDAPATIRVVVTTGNSSPIIKSKDIIILDNDIIIVGEIEGPEQVSEYSTAEFSITVENGVNETFLWTLDLVTAGVLFPDNESSTTLTPNPVDVDTHVTIRVDITADNAEDTIRKTKDITITDFTDPLSCLCLAKVMDQYHKDLFVYQDADSAGNHFVARGEMGFYIDNPVDGLPEQPPMNERCTLDPYSGLECIECKFNCIDNPGTLEIEDNWAGWYFNHGYLEGEMTVPAVNWGKWDAGEDLTGANTLSFYARGAAGGETVEFFCFGVGIDPDTGLPEDAENLPFYDTSQKITLGHKVLSDEWEYYEIDVSGAGMNRINGGFGWAARASYNSFQDITFYIDEIKYDHPRLDEPRFLLSYKSEPSGINFDIINRNVAFVYDNALALIAFLQCGEYERARLVGDALVYAQEHDRWFTDGRLRNGYQAGDLVLFDGWIPNYLPGTVRMPGWYDMAHEHWYEDIFCVSTDTGNVAWAMIALLALHQNTFDDKYLTAASQMGDWIASDPVYSLWADDSLGGFYGGWLGWEQPTGQTMHTYRSTEHNIDLWAAYERLYEITQDSKWHDYALHARIFVENMWNGPGGHFWTGTMPGSTDINTDVIPLDPQTWAILSLQDTDGAYWAGLNFVEDNMDFDCGYDFSIIPGEAQDGIWYEGTAQMAAVYKYIGNYEEAGLLIDCILGFGQAPSYCVYAASKDGLTTGFDLPTDPPEPWLYYKREHIGATAWYIFAVKGINPYWY